MKAITQSNVNGYLSSRSNSDSHASEVRDNTGPAPAATTPDAFTAAFEDAIANCSDGKIPVGKMHEILAQMVANGTKSIAIHRQTNQMLQQNANALRLATYDKKRLSAKEGFEAENKKALGNILHGAIVTATAGVGIKGAIQKTALQHASELGKIGLIADGSMQRRANESSLTAQLMSAEVEYSQSTTEQIHKNAEDALHQALKTSADMQQQNAQLTQMVGKLSGSR